ncbi:MAG: hypothetical protein ABUK01_14680 [Leptospirales bacterium]
MTVDEGIFVLNQILDRIDENQLFVPAFQREYVWKKDDAKYKANI